MFDLSSPICEIPLVFLDVETTGLRPQWGDRVCEVAMLRVQRGEVVDALQQLVNPQRPMDPRAYAVHGIGDDLLRDAPLFAEVAGDVADLLCGAVVIGHNIPFDLSFLGAEFARARRELPVSVALDTLRLARRHYQFARYALGAVAQALQVSVNGQGHRAMVDVLATRGVFERIADDLWPLGVRTVAQFIAAQGGDVNGVPSMARVPSLDVPELIQEALREGRLLYIRYLSERGEQTERLVRPLNVFDSGGELILSAHCQLRNALRHFRLDRIVDMELVELTSAR